MKCHIMADGRMMVIGSNPIEYEFLALPRIGERIVISVDGAAQSFRVFDIAHYAAGVEGAPNVLLWANQSAA